MRVARRFVVSGRVQGVGFRYFTQDTAQREGVTYTLMHKSPVPLLLAH